MKSATAAAAAMFLFAAGASAQQRIEVGSGGGVQGRLEASDQSLGEDESRFDDYRIRLRARNRLNAAGDSESGFLDPLREILASGRTPAERLLDRHRGEWAGDLSRIYDEESF